MKIYKNFEINKNFKRSILAIGNFDGMHKGHQKVLNLALKKAKKENLKCGILSFEPSPFIFFTKNKNHNLYSLSQKISFFKKKKVDFFIVKKFDKKFRCIPYKEFIKKILFKKLNIKYIFISKNFKFGKNRKGDVKSLKKYENKFGFISFITKPFKVDGKVISSTIIRKFIKEGNILKANKYLGKEWTVTGKVESGEKRGRKIGFPTCNLNFKNYIIPKFGVYSVLVSCNGLFINKKGIANVGLRPTFGGKNIILEVNIFGINKNLYKKRLDVIFKKFIRPEKKFDNINELKLQIKKDIKISKR